MDDNQTQFQQHDYTERARNQVNTLNSDPLNLLRNKQNINNQKKNGVVQFEDVFNDVNDEETSLNGKIVSSIIVLMFMVHPTITTQMFNQFNCQDIDGTERLYEDPEIVCYTSHHYYFALLVALPSIFVWSLGIPTFALVKLIHQRHELNLLSVKQQLGFLYNGYKEHSYYWEIIIMYRKIFIIFIAVFLGEQGKIVQALTILIFLILCIALNSIKQPFINHKLNSLEQMSLTSAALTVYCGIFYISNGKVVGIQDSSKQNYKNDQIAQYQ